MGKGDNGLQICDICRGDFGEYEKGLKTK